MICFCEPFPIAQADVSGSLPIDPVLGGLLAVLAVLGLVTLRSMSLARRPTFNRKAVYSLTAALVATLFYVLAVILGRLVGGFNCVSFLLGLMSLAFVAVAVVQGLAGKSELASDPRHRSRHGSSQAGWGIALSAATALLVVLTCGLAIVQAVDESIGVEPPVASRPLQPPTQFEDQVQTVKPAQAFPDWNFSFEPPDAPWSVAPPERLQPDSILGYARTEPDVNFVVVAEAMGADAGGSTESLAELERSRLSAAWPGSRINQPRPWPVNGMDGLRFDSIVQGPEGRYAYSHWLYASKGFGYRLMVWGDVRQRGAVQANAELLFGRFRMLDAAKVASSPGAGTANEYRSDRFGYRVALPEPGWSVWSALAEQIPEAEYGARGPADLTLVVVPVYLSETEPHQEALLHALLARIEVEYPQEEVFDLEPLERSGLSGWSFWRLVTEGGQQRRCRFRVLQGRGFAWLVAAWTPQPKEDFQSVDRKLEAALECVTIPETIEPPKLAELSSNQRHRQSKFFNDLGLHYYGLREYDQCQQYFRKAGDFEPGPAVAGNLTQAYIAGQRYQEAFDALDEYFRHHRQAQPELRAQQAWLHARLGRPDAAEQLYARLFAGVYFDKTHFDDYVDLLLAADRGEEALAAVEAQLKKRPSVALVELKARVLAKVGRAEKSD
jgi:tetratricopeptide (TPR) repeat protein